MTTIRRRSASPEDWLDTATHIYDVVLPEGRHYAITQIAEHLAHAFGSGEIAHLGEEIASIQEDLRHERA